MLKLVSDMLTFVCYNFNFVKYISRAEVTMYRVDLKVVARCSVPC